MESKGSFEIGPQRNDAVPRSKLAAGLYVVATPIGNMADITLRALDVLRRADLVACEDTRVTAPLLARHGLKARLIAYHDHNAERVRPKLLERLSEGAAVALVSDAGTPLVSDPGYRLVRSALDGGHSVTVVPGPSATLAALILSGLPTDRFLFLGFLPSRAAARRKALAEVAAVRATLVMFESAHRLAASLADMAAALGDRDAAVVREITKLYEESRRGRLPELADAYAGEKPPKGEIVVVVGPPPEAAMAQTEGAAAREMDPALDLALDEKLRDHSLRDAVALVAAETGIPRRRVYARALARGARKDEPE
ncbi:MAG: 16S rRNA (cytidine(1402)-2'-O)-methyltransferase [Alphaproteobacteria bacterium]